MHLGSRVLQFALSESDRSGLMCLASKSFGGATLPSRASLIPNEVTGLDTWATPYRSLAMRVTRTPAVPYGAVPKQAGHLCARAGRGSATHRGSALEPSRDTTHSSPPRRIARLPHARRRSCVQVVGARLVDGAKATRRISLNDRSREELCPVRSKLLRP